MFELIIFTLALQTTIGSDGLPGKVPAEYSIQVYYSAKHHGIDPVEQGALLLAENKSRKYNPQTVGKYGKGGEAGLFQLARVWGRLATKRCSFISKKGKYDGLQECLSVPRDVKVRYRCDLDEEGNKINEDCIDMFDPDVNIEAASIAIAYMQNSHLEHLSRDDPDRDWNWRTHYRCNSNPDSRNSVKCQKSVGRVLEWQKRIRVQMDGYEKSFLHIATGFVNIQESVAHHLLWRILFPVTNSPYS